MISQDRNINHLGAASLNPAILNSGLVCIIFLILSGYVFFCEPSIALIFSFGLFSVICLYFVNRKDRCLFDPFFMFSILYSTVPISAFYYHLNEFETSIVVANSYFAHSLKYLFNVSMFYYFVGYVFCLVGYLLIKSRFFVQNKLPRTFLIEEEDTKVSRYIIYFFVSIGVFNFVYNIFVLSGGNVFEYMLTTAARKHQLEDARITIIGYHFSFVGMYFWCFLKKLGKKEWFAFGFFLFLTIIMKLSTGRITNTMVYSCSFLVIYYVRALSLGRPLNNRKFCLGFLILAFSALSLYFIRIFSALYFQGILDFEKAQEVISFDKVLYLIFDRGNVPHIPIFMKIIDSWGMDHGFMYGKTLFTWVFSILPTSFVDPGDYLISLKINSLWFSDIEGAGGLPPTGVGEMYANFGMLGPFLGMFLFGIFCGTLYFYLYKSGSYIFLIIYSQILLGFVLIYPKTDFANLSPWYILPHLLTYLLIKNISRISRLWHREKITH